MTSRSVPSGAAVKDVETINEVETKVETRIRRRRIPPANAVQMMMAVTKRHVRNLVWNFFTEPVHPIRLAIFRFLAFLGLLIFEPQDLHSKSSWPAEARVPIQGYSEGLFHSIPISVAITETLLPCMYVTCLCASVGFLFPITGWTTVILATYLYGIPQCFGMLSRYHHLLWLTYVLAASPHCVDTLSVDQFFFLARRRSSRRSSRSSQQHSYASQSSKPSSCSSWIYGLPIKMAMLLMSVVYFFPGFYKLWYSGYEWMVTGNALRNIFLHKLVNNAEDLFVPLFRLDQYPLLCQLGGIAAIVFEISYPILILYPRLRPLLVVTAISFHLGVELFLGIVFHSLIWATASVFVNWYHVIVWLQSNLKKASSSVLFPETFPSAWMTLGLKEELESLQDNSWRHSTGRRKIRSTVVVGTTLLILTVIAGVFKIDSWPITIYPTFTSASFHTDSTIWTTSLYYYHYSTNNNNEAKGEEVFIPMKQVIRAFSRPSIWGTFQRRNFPWPPPTKVNDLEKKRRCLVLRTILQPVVPQLRTLASSSSTQNDRTGLILYKEERWLDRSKYESPKQRIFYTQC